MQQKQTWCESRCTKVASWFTGVLAACWAFTNLKIINVVLEFYSLDLCGGQKKNVEIKKKLAVRVKKNIQQWKQAKETTSGPKTISQSKRFINPLRKLLIWFTWQISLDIYHRCRQVTSALCLFAADSVNFHVIGSYCVPLTSCCRCLTDVGLLMLICVSPKFPSLLPTWLCSQ